MTAILGIFANDGHMADEALVARMLRNMSSRGGAHACIWREGGVVLAVSRHEWEFSRGFSGPVLVVQEGDHVIAADASLYYRDDLRRKLAAKGVHPKGKTPSHLILAAYQAFGEQCPEVLEGDFSFVIWDRKLRRVIAVRDFSGARPLFFAELNGVLVIASTMAACLEHPRCDAALDVDALGLDAAGLAFSVSDATCYRSIRRLDAGSSLVSVNSSPARVRRYWSPIVGEIPGRSSFDNAAAELRELLGNAVIERVDPERQTAVWLSGGWDSTAVFGAGQWQLANKGMRDCLSPVSISHPAGDPACEDDKIRETAALWKSRVNWLFAKDIPFIEPLVSRSESRDEPIEHFFTGINGALANKSRLIGTRAALDGYGGDALFLNSNGFLADLLASGQFVNLAREWSLLWKYGYRSRQFFRFAVQPMLPPIALAGLARARRRESLASPFERSLPRWMNEDFARQHRLRERAHADGTLPTAMRRADAEVQWALNQRFFMRTRCFLNGVALENGVELRAPLYDKRVIEFSITRPATERNSMGEHKRLLRQAMEGLLPTSVLSSRRFRTGSPDEYLRTSLASAEALIRSIIAQPLALSEIGIVEESAFRNAFDRFFRRGCRGADRIDLVHTLLAELWVRTQRDQSAPELAIGSHSWRHAKEGKQVSLTATRAVLVSGKSNPDIPMIMEDKCT